jgi:thioredoxin 2
VGQALSPANAFHICHNKFSGMTDTDLIHCPSCGANNRVPREKIEQGLKPVCGRCKTPLAAASNPLTITDANFSAEVEHSPLPLLLDMWAPWCGPCKMIAPVIEQLASDYAGRLRVGKLNVDENPVTAERYNVRSIPALLVFKAGQEVDRMVGAQPKAAILRRLEPFLA